LPRPPPEVLCNSGTGLTAADLAVTLDAIIAPVVADLGYDLVRIQLSGKPGDMTLQVMAEDRTTGQLTLGQCAEISRALDLPLEEADPIESEYALEVSSPGIDRPLTRRSDWEKWAGHEVRLKLDPPVDGRARAHGVITGIESDIVTLEVKSVGPVALPFAAISAAKLVLTPKLINATRPLDASGADEVIELPEIADENTTDNAADNDNDTTED
jgi:ribosome maturation factor RimP